jgi:hypothetical protein
MIASETFKIVILLTNAEIGYWHLVKRPMGVTLYQEKVCRAGSILYGR